MNDDKVRGRSSWPLPIPTARAAWLVAASAAVSAAGAASPLFGWIGIAAVASTFCAIVVDFVLAARGASFDATRVARPDLGAARREVLEVELRALEAPETGAPRSVRAQVAFDLPETFELVAEPAPFTIDAGERLTLATTVIATRRGRHQLGDVHLRTFGPLALAARDSVFPMATEARVVPGLSAISEATQILRRGLRAERGARRTRRRGDGTAFELLRDHQPGEDLRRVDWKASARHGRLIARQFEVERNQSLILLVDCGRYMSGEVDGGRTRLDHVLDATVLLAQVAALRDDRIGLLAFSDRVLRWVPPTKGNAAVSQIVEAIFDLEPTMVESDYGRAFAHLRVHQRKRSLMVLFTDVMSKDQSRVVSDELRRAAKRHLPLCVSLRDLDLDRIVADVPKDASAAFRQGAAEDLLLEREETLLRMRRSGVQILDTDPRRIGPPLIERYFDLKARTVV